MILKNQITESKHKMKYEKNNTGILKNGKKGNDPDYHGFEKQDY